MNRVYLDLGNTALKVYSDDGDLVEVYLSRDEAWIENFACMVNRHPIKQAVLASVAVKEKEAAVMSRLDGIEVLSASYDIGEWQIQHSYKNPAKLGIDRLLAIEAAYRETQNSLVVIDCGSAITVDSVDSSGFHQGGFIVPGYRLQMESLLSGTNLSFDVIDPTLALGSDTSECIRNGSFRMISSFCQSVIEEMKPSTVILTGGDLNGVLAPLKVFGEVDEQLVFKGLKYVYG